MNCSVNAHLRHTNNMPISVSHVNRISFSNNIIQLTTHLALFDQFSSLQDIFTPNYSQCHVWTCEGRAALINQLIMVMARVLLHPNESTNATE